MNVKIIFHSTKKWAVTILNFCKRKYLPHPDGHSQMTQTGPIQKRRSSLHSSTKRPLVPSFSEVFPLKDASEKEAK